MSSRPQQPQQPQPKPQPQQKRDSLTTFRGRDESKVEFLMKELLFTPPVLDGLGILWVVTGQSILLNTASLAGFILGVDILNFSHFAINPSALASGLGGGALLAGLGLLFDNIPSEFFQSVSRDTKLYTLRLIGRNTKFIPALVASSFISTGN
jgi:hypothetical protein